MADVKKIEYRVVTPEEKLHVARQQRVSFPFPPFDFNETDIRNKIAKGEYKSDNTYGAIGENGRVLAGMDVLPFKMWFDGQKVSMFGISGVVSFPESRRQGNVRNMFLAAFEDMYEKGATFSHLFPFSYDYYRQFGYEHCGLANKYTLPIATARKLHNNGTVHEFIEGDSVRDKLIEIYEKYASRHNIMISRSEECWITVFSVSLFSHDRLYYWANSNNDIKAWVKFIRVVDKIIISDIVWTDHESMLGILQFIGMYEGVVEKMVFRSSPEFIADLYWNELNQVTTEAAWLGMSRVINAERALELMKKPNEDGKFVIKITDSLAKWNNNLYKVEYGGGQCMVTTGEEASGADIEVTERTFTQMILGVYELKRLADKGCTRINGNAETLEKVFLKKPLLLTDIF